MVGFILFWARGEGGRRRELCGEWDFLRSVCGLQYYMHSLDVSWSELLSVYSERERQGTCSQPDIAGCHSA